MTYRIARRIDGETTWFKRHPKAPRFFTAFREEATTYRTKHGARVAVGMLTRADLYGDFHIVEDNAAAPWGRLA